MGLTLVETSAWVEFDRATGSPAHVGLRTLLAGDDRQVAVTEPVLMEILAGARTEDRASRLRGLLRAQVWLAIDLAADFDGAASLYRRCRRAGVTPRGLLDCLIATIAIRHDVDLLCHDRGFAAIASVSDLRLSLPGDR